MFDLAYGKKEKVKSTTSAIKRTDTREPAASYYTLTLTQTQKRV